MWLGDISSPVMLGCPWQPWKDPPLPHELQRSSWQHKSHPWTLGASCWPAQGLEPVKVRFSGGKTQAVMKPAVNLEQWVKEWKIKGMQELPNSRQWEEPITHLENHHIAAFARTTHLYLLFPSLQVNVARKALQRFPLDLSPVGLGYIGRGKDKVERTFQKIGASWTAGQRQESVWLAWLRGSEQTTSELLGSIKWDSGWEWGRSGDWGLVGSILNVGFLFNGRLCLGHPAELCQRVGRLALSQSPARAAEVDSTKVPWLWEGSHPIPCTRSLSHRDFLPRTFSTCFQASVFCSRG